MELPSSSPASRSYSSLVSWFSVPRLDILLFVVKGGDLLAVMLVPFAMVRLEPVVVVVVASEVVRSRPWESRSAKV